MRGEWKEAENSLNSRLPFRTIEEALPAWPLCAPESFSVLCSFAPAKDHTEGKRHGFPPNVFPRLVHLPQLPAQKPEEIQRLKYFPSES